MGGASHRAAGTGPEREPGPGHYGVLGVPADATAAEIKQAYRERARVTHPDVSTAKNATALFAAVQRAYGVLSDAAERAAYDRTMAQRARRGEPGAGGAGRGRSAARQEPRYAWENIGQPKGEGPGSGRGRKRKGGAAGGEAQGIESGFEEVWRAFYGPREKAEREKRG